MDLVILWASRRASLVAPDPHSKRYLVPRDYTPRLQSCGLDRSDYQ